MVSWQTLVLYRNRSGLTHYSKQKNHKGFLVYSVGLCDTCGEEIRMPNSERILSVTRKQMDIAGFIYRAFPPENESYPDDSTGNYGCVGFYRSVYWFSLANGNISN